MVNVVVIHCYCLLVYSQLTVPRRQFPHEPYRPQACPEASMVAYLMDCYSAVQMEERRTPQVGR
jgi:hypothetical protein